MSGLPNSGKTPTPDSPMRAPEIGRHPAQTTAPALTLLEVLGRLEAVLLGVLEDEGRCQDAHVVARLVR